MAGRSDRLLYPLLRLGWPGALGAGLVVAALLADAVLLRPGEAELAAMAGRRTAVTVPGEADARATAQADGTEATLRRLFASARRAGLDLDQGDYQLTRGQAEGPAHYRLALPVQGRYPAIRGFVADLLNDEPALALAALRLSRAAIGDDRVEADLQFVLYLRGAR